MNGLDVPKFIYLLIYLFNIYLFIYQIIIYLLFSPTCY